MHKQAALNTVKFFAAAFAVGILVALGAEYLTAGQFMSVIGIGVLAFFINIFYSIEKSRLESLEKLNDRT